jgi:hypothetical protein
MYVKVWSLCPGSGGTEIARPRLDLNSLENMLEVVSLLRPFYWVFHQDTQASRLTIGDIREGDFDILQRPYSLGFSRQSSGDGLSRVDGPVAAGRYGDLELRRVGQTAGLFVLRESSMMVFLFFKGHHRAGSLRFHRHRLRSSLRLLRIWYLDTIARERRRENFLQGSNCSGVISFRTILCELCTREGVLAV